MRAESDLWTVRPSARPPICPSPGFTLIEVVVVLTLLGIMAAVVVPAFRALTTSDARTESIATALKLIRSARAAALTRASDVTLRIDPSRTTFRLETDSAGAVVTLQQGTLAFPEGVTLRGTGPRLALTFHRDGTAEGDSLTIDTRDGAAMIAVDRWTGEPHVQ